MVIPYRRFGTMAIPYRRFGTMAISYRRFGTVVIHGYRCCLITQKSAILIYFATKARYVENLTRCQALTEEGTRNAEYWDEMPCGLAGSYKMAAADFSETVVPVTRFHGVILRKTLKLENKCICRDVSSSGILRSAERQFLIDVSGRPVESHKYRLSRNVGNELPHCAA